MPHYAHFVIIGFLLIATISFISLRPSTAGNMIPYTDSGSIAHGKTLYDAHCASCHGANLQGQPNWRQPDADGYMPAPPHDASGHTWHHPDEHLFAITKFGTEAIVGGSYKSRMAGYQDVLSDADILAVLAYIKSTWSADIITRHDHINANAKK